MGRKLFAEVVGTFALVFMGTGAIVKNHASGRTVTHVGIALTFGLAVPSIVYAIGDISGTHVNPAVTFGLALALCFSWASVALFVVVQCVGALAASALLRAIFPEHDKLGGTLPAGPVMQSFILEVVLTWFLMLVALCVSTGAKKKGITVGIAVGSVVALEALAAGPVCGASMNPTRSLAPAIVSGHLEHLWIYLIATPIGAAVAVLTGRVLLPVNDKVGSQT